MRIIPVLDLKGRVVVRGVAGRRAEYRPVVSRLTDSCQPADVARAFRDQLGLREFYVADLDAIGGAEPAWTIYRDLRALDCRTWVDAGIRECSQVLCLAEAVARIVVGLETVAGPTELEAIIDRLGASRVVFSLDLRGGVPLGDIAAWDAQSAEGIARQAVVFGVRSMIVLDLARVGVGGGIGTEELCSRLAREFSDLEIIAGGGVRGIEDLKKLADHGIQAALVASALHDGAITRGEIDRL
jgi:phosphoribosylformimino-5-aminoimidazole carboxamide ribotide isomerase